MAVTTAPPAARATSAAEKENGLDEAALLRAYRCMLLSRKIDDREIQLKKQSHTFFQISGAGHEAILVAAGMALKPAYDWFYPYYRDRALCLQLGVTPLDMLLAAVGAERDPSNGGRQMPSHWGVKALHIVSGSSATGMKALHAVGSADASVIFDRVTNIPDRHEKYHDDEVVYISLGDGTTSEGEFWESITAACGRKLPVLFLIEDNGYAISVPVEVQTPGGDISKLLRSFPGLHVDSVDGTDFLASVTAMNEAVAYVRARKGPAVVHARVTRPYAHSYTDNEALYKTPREREDEIARDPIRKLGEYLVSHGKATEADLAAALVSVEAEIDDAVSKALAAPKPAHEHGDEVGTRRTSIPRRKRSTRRRTPKASPTRWSRPSTARSRTRWRAVRISSSSAKTSRTPAGEMRSSSYPAKAASSRPDTRAADAVWRRSRVQRADR